jgi:hypothetical protein
VTGVGVIAQEPDDPWPQYRCRWVVIRLPSLIAIGRDPHLGSGSLLGKAQGSPAALQVPTKRARRRVRVIAQELDYAPPGGRLGPHPVGFPEPIGVLGYAELISHVALEQRLIEPVLLEVLPEGGRLGNLVQ